jgi:geranylgeranyl reductase family protein
MLTATTHQTEILVIGAGPAGSSTAMALASNGHDVLLVDRAEFPRDKVCGDALIPDALGALRGLGVDGAIEQHATRLAELRVYAPNHNYVSLAGDFWCLPRRELDYALTQAAVARGAALRQRFRVLRPLLDKGTITGAVFADDEQHEVTIRARYTVLATGADPTMVSVFGVGSRLAANAAALRAYFEPDEHMRAAMNYLVIAYDAHLCPGYGWIFPGPDGRFNVGVGWFGNLERRRRPNLHALWRVFVQEFPLARDLVRRARQLSPLRGAPMRTGLRGSLLGRPGLIVVGEAAGLTYPATGEGIGKAIESGIIAARILDGSSGSEARCRVHVSYANEIRRAFDSRFAAYRIAERWLSRPWLLNWLTQRANAGRFVKRELERLIAETGDPSRLFSTTGLIRALLT